MPLTETEMNIAADVLQRFLNEHTATPRKHLIARYRDPEALRRLAERAVVLPNMDGSLYFPKVLAFYYCADENTLSIAKHSVEVVVRTLQEMFIESESDYPQFAPAEIEAKARHTDPKLAPEMIQLGLYLAQELGKLGGWNPNESGTEFKTVMINESILVPKNVERLWDDFVEQRRSPWDPSPQEANGSAPAGNILLAALRLFCADADMEQLIIRPHGADPPRSGVAAGFELHVGWLLGLLGLSTIVLSNHERLAAPGTKVQRATLDILASDQGKNLLLVVGCTLNPPKVEDFGSLRNVREIVKREAFAGTQTQVIPVLFTAALGGRPCDKDSSGDCVPIVDADKMKEVFGFLRDGRQIKFFEFLANPDPHSYPASFLFQA